MRKNAVSLYATVLDEAATTPDSARISTVTTITAAARGNISGVAIMWRHGCTSVIRF